MSDIAVPVSEDYYRLLEVIAQVERISVQDIVGMAVLDAIDKRMHSSDFQSHLSAWQRRTAEAITKLNGI